jgi:hypothetical protein
MDAHANEAHLVGNLVVADRVVTWLNQIQESFASYDPDKERETRILDEAKVLAGTIIR